MSIVLRVLESINMVEEGQTLLDAEERGYFLDEDRAAAKQALYEVITEDMDLEVVSLMLMVQRFMEEDKVLAVVHCVALLPALLKEDE